MSDEIAHTSPTILSLSGIPSEIILGNLTYRELGALRRTCKLARQKVDEYLKHYLRSLDYFGKLKNIVQIKDSFSFLPDAIQKLKRVDRFDRLVVFFLSTAILTIGDIKRIEVESTFFSHQQLYEYDSTRQRVVFREKHNFVAIDTRLGKFAKGFYQLRLHFYANLHTAWPNETQEVMALSKIFLKKNFRYVHQGEEGAYAFDCYGSVLSDEIPVKVWQLLCVEDIQSLSFAHSRIIAKDDPRCFYFEFDSFKLDSDTELEFRLDLASGMEDNFYFEYFEIRSLNPPHMT